MSEDAQAPDEKDIERRMDGALSALKTEFSGLRTGRASPHLLDPVTVDAYGSPTPISQVATVSVPESRMLSVQVWDKSMVGAVDKAIRESGLGVNPVVDGQLLRIPIPPLNEERRAELTKVAAKYAEQARVAVRNVRRDGMDHLKRFEKAGGVGEDDAKKVAERIQKMTDAEVKKIDDMLAQKEQEIMQV